jgi:hypothetical protein
MNILKIIQGKVELHKDSGSLIRIIGNGGVVNADISNDGSLIPVVRCLGEKFKSQKFLQKKWLS